MRARCERLGRHRGTRPAGSSRRDGQHAARRRPCAASRAAASRARSTSVPRCAPRHRALRRPRCSAQHRLDGRAGDGIGRNDRLRSSAMIVGCAISVPQRAPASAVAPSTACAARRGSGAASSRAARLRLRRRTRRRPRRRRPARAARAARQTRSSCGRRAALPVGLFGEHRKTSLVAASTAARIAGTSSAKPASRSSGTVDDRAHPGCAPPPRTCRRSAGRSITLSSPARQKTRTSRSMASSLPRPTSSVAGSHAVERRRVRCTSAAAAARDSGSGRPRSHRPGTRHGSSLACMRVERRFPGGVLVGLQRADVRARARASDRVHRRDVPAQRREPHGDRAGVRIEPFEVAPACAPSGPRSREPAGVSSCTVMRLTEIDAATGRCRRAHSRRSAARGWCRSSSRPSVSGDQAPRNTEPALRDARRASARGSRVWMIRCSGA